MPTVSRDYIVTHPDGHEQAIHGLTAFCAQWGLGLRGLTNVARGKHHQHKGFRIRYAVNPFPAKTKSPQERGCEYIVTHPDGHEETIRGLTTFCAEWELDLSCLGGVARGKQHQHKGFRIRYAVNPFPEKPKSASRAHFYIVSHPDGHEETIQGLEAFRLEHGLDQGALTNVALGKAHHHKGFRIRYAVNPFPEKPEPPPNAPITYIITHPDGREETIRGLPTFCKRHGLAPSNMTLVAQGKRKQGHHKGYRCRYRDRDPHVPVERTVRMIPCEVCGKSFEAKANNAKYCPNCKKAAKSRRTRERKSVRQGALYVSLLGPR
jgi:hypothetical protein